MRNCPGFRASWAGPVSVSLRLEFDPEHWRSGKLRGVAAWLSRASQVLAEPEPGKGRTLWFDLGARHCPETVPELVRWDNEDAFPTDGAALLELLGGQVAPPFERFEKLVDVFAGGRFTDLNILLRKTDTDDILSFDEFSDGEQMVLGRMALLHLLKDQDDVLLLLDEPETHFNDKWKREIVEIVDETIRDTANDVLISTHSAIVLSDVFHDEIVLLEKTEDGARRVELASPTFGADPSELMVRVFGAPESVGKRAQEWLEARLPEGEWTVDEIDELEALIKKIGPGFYRSELRTLLNKKKKERDAPPD